MFTDLKMRDDPPVPNDHGYVSAPRLTKHQFGTVIGLPQRLAAWCDRMGKDRSLPWAGLGIIKDLETAMQLLNLTEFAEWLRTKGDPAYQHFGDDILADQETIEAVHQALHTAGHDQHDPVAGVEALDREVRSVDAIRQVLIDTGALAKDDTETALPDLLRALLS
jgi:hypothetical protein